MDLAAWLGPQGVFSSGGAAHIFGSGSVARNLEHFGCALPGGDPPMMGNTHSATRASRENDGRHLGFRF
jgi:hypothetical protein